MPKLWAALLHRLGLHRLEFIVGSTIPQAEVQLWEALFHRLGFWTE